MIQNIIVLNTLADITNSTIGIFNSKLKPESCMYELCVMPVTQVLKLKFEAYSYNKKSIFAVI